MNESSLALRRRVGWFQIKMNLILDSFFFWAVSNSSIKTCFTVRTDIFFLFVGNINLKLWSLCWNWLCRLDFKAIFLGNSRTLLRSSWVAINFLLNANYFMFSFKLNRYLNFVISQRDDFILVNSFVQIKVSPIPKTESVTKQLSCSLPVCKKKVAPWDSLV